jgi:hypothetical protein
MIRNDSAYTANLDPTPPSLDPRTLAEGHCSPDPKDHSEASGSFDPVFRI